MERYFSGKGPLQNSPKTANVSRAKPCEVANQKLKRERHFINTGSEENAEDMSIHSSSRFHAD